MGLRIDVLDVPHIQRSIYVKITLTICFISLGNGQTRFWQLKWIIWALIDAI